MSRHLELSSRRTAKPRQESTSKIHSLSSFQRYRQALGQAGKWARIHHGIRRLDHLTPEMAMSYLASRRDQGICQKQLDNDRVSMQFMTGKLARVFAFENREPASRAYSKDEAERIASRQADHNGLATRIAYNAGLRAHELLTLRRVDEGALSYHRAWRNDRFHGRAGERYLVTGQGGLTREVLLSPELSKELEARRLESPQIARDRGINYETRYDIGGGHGWSNSFSKRSMRAFGWSAGTLGLRSSYRRERMAGLRRLGHRDVEARLILSQELG